LWSLGGDQKLLSLDDVLLPCLIYVLASSAGPHVLFYTRPVCASLSEGQAGGGEGQEEKEEASDVQAI